MGTKRKTTPKKISEPKKKVTVRILNEEQLQQITSWIDTIPTKYGLPLVQFINSLEKKEQ